MIVNNSAFGAWHFILWRQQCLYLFIVVQHVTCRVTHEDGKSQDIALNHSMNEQQIAWFKAGSALNRMKEMSAGR